MPPELSNLPSSGVLANASNIRWSLQPTSRFALASTSHSPDQVLQRDNTTETLVRILRQQQQDPAARTQQKKGNGAAATGTKRALDPPADNQAGKKKLAVAANLLASAAATASTSGQDQSKRSYTQDELKAKTIKELQDILKARGMPVSGKKEVLVQRMIDFQRRQKVAALGNS